MRCRFASSPSNDTRKHHECWKSELCDGMLAWYSWNVGDHIIDWRQELSLKHVGVDAAPCEEGNLHVS